jgi:peptidoglycan/LPS O-acetylase OafA/YrhL
MAYSFNTPAWYLSMMVFIWFMIPLTKYCYNKYAVLRKKNSWLVSLSIEIILLVLFYNCHFEASLQRWFMYVNPFINYLIFLTAFLYTKSVKAGSRNFKVLAIFCCILLALYMLKDYIPVDFRILFFQIPVLIVVYISYFNDAISEHNTTIKSMRFLNYIGENSNHLFLSHYFVCKIYRSLGINNVGIFILCWISIFLINYIDVLIGTKFKLLTKKVKAVES